MYSRFGERESGDPATVEQELRRLSMLAPRERRDALAALGVEERTELVINAFAYGATREDPWNTRSDADLMAAVLESFVAGMAVGSSAEWDEARRVKETFSGQAHLLRAIEADAAGDRAEAHRKFALAEQQGLQADDGLACLLGSLGMVTCGTEAHRADLPGILEAVGPVFDTLESWTGGGLSDVRLAFSMRYEAFHVVEEMTQTADPDAMADLADSWLEQRPAGALMALIHAWFGELQRGLADGDVDWAMAWAVVGDRLIVPVAPAAPFRKRLADHFDDAGDVDRALRIHNGLLAENPDDGERLVAVAKALSRTDRADEAIALLRSRLSDPPIAGEEGILQELTILLVKEGSPEAGLWDSEFRRLTGAGLGDLMPTRGPAAPTAQRAFARLEDGRLTISPDMGTLPPGEIKPQIFAAMIAGNPDGAQQLAELAESEPLLAAAVARLLGVPLTTRAHREAAQHIQQGEEHFQRRAYAEAAGCYQRALDVDPESYTALLALGDVYFVIGCMASARVYFQESLAVAETPMAWRFLGDTFRAERGASATEAARSCYLRALALDPNYGGARQALEQLPSSAGAAPPAPPAPPSGSAHAEEHRHTATPRPGIPTAAFAVGPGIEADLPPRVEESLRRDQPAIGSMLDRLADDEDFARWLVDDGPEHWPAALTGLTVLVHQWSARGTDPERALLLARRGVQIAEALDDPWPEGDPDDRGKARCLAEALEQLAGVNTELGRYSEAYDLLKTAEQWADTDEAERARTGRSQRIGMDHFDDRPRRAGQYEALAAAARRSGDDAGAEHYTRLRRERENGSPVTDHQRVVDLVTEGMTAYLRDGDMELALQRLFAAERFAEREAALSPVPVALATAHHNLGRLLTWFGLPRRALHHLATARELNAGNANRLATDWIATAQILERWPHLGHDTLAYEQVLALSSVPGTIGEPLFWAPRGEPTARTGRRIVAVERAWDVIMPMARSAWEYGELYTATDVLELGTGLADLVRAAQPDPDLRMRIQDERVTVFELLTRYRLERASRSDGDPESHVIAAYTASERKRSRALLDTMSTARLRAPVGVPPPLLDREAELLSARTEVERGGAVDWTRHHVLTGELTTLWARMAECGAEAAEYAAIRQADVLTPADVISELAGESAVVASYAILDDGQIVVFTIGAETGLRVAHIDADGPRMLGFIEDHFGSAGQVREMAEDMPGLFQHVLAPLVAPLTAVASPGQTLLICPTGALHHVPFHALSVDGFPTLLDRNPIGRLPTVSLLRTMNHRPPGTGTDAVVLGDPGLDLPYARTEAVALGSRLGTVPLLGDTATREEVLLRVPNTSVFHAACHAHFDADDPLSSGLILAGGVLTARDILQQDWHSVRLAVLSACETGVSRTSRTDETLGLSRSLLFAGVRSLVMSLWRVPDSTTAAIMGDFHDLTLGGAAPAHALRAAMLAARDRAGDERIDRWAAFCLLGDWRAPTRPTPRDGG
ncbi:CHAT domain-containing protein [Streptomyces sp. NBC_00691]|uniref:CHAT domain-containing protein n=1 Tax=Streptomyces sp. NBC_00691 TaxID=2903671 RepID=UPI002E378C6B|nr:CHAT domain-containing tetratricopeptide repeat protein [Streptomyces sp. NBC_00691]